MTAPALWIALLASLPPLPPLALEQFPPPVREKLSAALQRAQQRPTDADAAGALGMLLHAHDQVGAASQAYERAQALDPSAFDWHYLAGVLALRAGRAAEAVEALVAAAGRAPGSAPTRVRLGEALISAGRAADAEAVFRRLVAEEPALPQAHYGLGRALAARGDTARALEHYEAAVRHFPRFGAALYALGLAYRDLGRADEARERLAAYERHVMDAPPLADPLMQRVTAMGPRAVEALEEGVRLSRTGDLEGAVREHLRALEADPGLVRAHANLIALYARLGRAAEADRHYRAAVAIDANAVEVHYNRGLALQDAGRPREAGDALRRVLELSPRHARAHDRLGLLLEAEGHLEDAARHYAEAAANESGFREARFSLARVRLAQDRPADAAAELEGILEPEDEHTPRYLFALAAAYARTGDRTRALARLAQARRLAEAHGQTALAAAIARDEQRLRASPAP